MNFDEAIIEWSKNGRKFDGDWRDEEEEIPAGAKITDIQFVSDRRGQTVSISYSTEDSWFNYIEKEVDDEGTLTKLGLMRFLFEKASQKRPLTTARDA